MGDRHPIRGTPGLVGMARTGKRSGSPGYVVWQAIVAGFVGLCLGAGLSSQARAEIYRWVDEQGNVNFSDKASERHESDTVRVRVNTYAAVSYDVSLFDTGRKVVMYSASWCGHCKRAKRYFRKHRIPFTEYDIEKDRKARARYDRMRAAGVPVILVGKRRMNGFSEAGFEKIYR
jgi:glutaredoxin